MSDTRQHIEAALEQLLTDLAQPGRSLLPALGIMSRFPRYSLANQFLILAQRPSATCVMGYRAWQKAGYQVRKGERGIAIWAPMFLRPRATAADELDESAADRTRLRYRLAYVFDLASCDPLPATGSGAEPLPNSPAAPLPELAASFERLKLAALDANLALEERPLGPIDGCTDGRRITLNTQRTLEVRACTLVHELAHAILHFVTPRPAETLRETEAEGVAYVVASALGIPTTHASVDYIRAWRGTPDSLRDSLERIRATANRVLDVVGSIRFDLTAPPSPD